METLLFYMANKIQGQRSLAGCYHILTGKKSGQAIQDSALFGFSSWFGLFPDWKREHFETLITQLTTNNQIIPVGDSFVPAPEALREIEKDWRNLRFVERAFLIDQDVAHVHEIEKFWKRFQLLSQVISYYLYDTRRYNPFISELETQAWVKKFWASVQAKESFVQQVKEDLSKYLREIKDELLIQLVVDRLNGYKVTPRTIHQLSVSYKLPEALIRLYLLQSIGLLYISIKNDPFSSLKEVTIFKGDETDRLTRSAKLTYELLKRGLGAEEISRRRGLKMNTIEDHLIEMAIHITDFDPAPYLSKELLYSIGQVSKELRTKKLFPIKQKIGEEVSYFQIRLALVKGVSYE